MRRFKIPLFISLIFSLFCTTGFSGNTSIDTTLRVGVKPAPPFVLNDVYNTEGLSLKLWNSIALESGIKYELVPYQTVEELITATKNNEIDLSINPVTVTEKRMGELDFSQPFYISSTVVAKRKESAFLDLFKNLFSWRFLSAIAILLTVILLFGVLVWVFERKRNKEQFGGKGLKGIGQGFWWSAVTMTTVGYGDKAPVTTGGRVVGFIWMFAALILFSGLTAGIASALTVRNLDEEISNYSDLKGYKVGSVKGSSPALSLANYHSNPKEYADVDEGLKALADGEINFFVYDKPILEYHINNHEYETELVVTDVALRTDYYSFLFPKNSPYYEALNTRIVAKIKSTEWELEMAK